MFSFGRQSACYLVRSGGSKRVSFEQLKNCGQCSELNQAFGIVVENKGTHLEACNSGEDQSTSQP